MPLIMNRSRSAGADPAACLGIGLVSPGQEPPSGPSSESQQWWEDREVLQRERGQVRPLWARYRLVALGVALGTLVAAIQAPAGPASSRLAEGSAAKAQGTRSAQAPPATAAVPRSPQTPPARPVLPHLTDVSATAGLAFRHVNGPADRKDYIFEAKGGGVGALDFDNDGWLDLAFAQGSTVDEWRRGTGGQPALFRNRGDGTFEDVSRKAGLDHRGWGMGIAAADYDNDGYVDLYLTCLGPDVLYRNQGNGTFRDVTKAAGIDAPGWSASAAFGDFDQDGDLDLYVASYLDVDPDRLPEERGGGTCNYLGQPVLCGPRGLPGARDLYFVNRGDGTFVERSEVSGAFDKERYFGLGVVVSDVDGDRDQDIYVGNDATPNYLFVNRGDGTFEERGFASGTALSGEGNEQASMGVDAADYDNDGLVDLYATHFASDTSTLYRNLGNLLFRDVTLTARVQEPEWPLVKWGTMFVDLDHDGWKDIVHANGHVYPHLRGAQGLETYEQPALTVYRNARDGTFVHASTECGKDAVQPMVGRGTAFGDFDNDGDMDVVIARLDGTPVMLRNEGTIGHHFLTVRTEGRWSNRDGLGARIWVKTGELEQMREIRRTVGIYSTSDPRAHFGLGRAERVDRLRIEWPSGQVDEFRDVAGGCSLPGARGGAPRPRAHPRPVSSGSGSPSVSGRCPSPTGTVAGPGLLPAARRGPTGAAKRGRRLLDLDPVLAEEELGRLSLGHCHLERCRLSEASIVCRYRLAHLLARQIVDEKLGCTLARGRLLETEAVGSHRDLGSSHHDLLLDEGHADVLGLDLGGVARGVEQAEDDAFSIGPLEHGGVALLGGNGIPLEIEVLDEARVEGLAFDQLVRRLGEGGRRARGRDDTDHE